MQVPPTCCKMDNSDPEKPEPTNYATCQNEAKNGTLSNKPQLHVEVRACALKVTVPT